MDTENLENYLLPVVVAGAGLAAYFGEISLHAAGFYLFTAAAAFSIREVGQRFLAGRIGASVNTLFSREGGLLTLLIAFISSVTVFSLALIIPSRNEYSIERHEQWGKGVDAIWSQRQYLIAFSGIAFLTVASTSAAFLGFQAFSLGLVVYTLSQMIPLRDLVIDGSTDGAFILFSSGFTWLIATGFNLMLLAFLAF